jgi:hypothetical protein
MERTIPTDSATIEHTASGITIIRFRSDVKLSTAVLAAVMHDRRDAGPRPPGMMMIMPEHTDYDAHIMDVDHRTALGEDHCTTSLAIVCQEPALLHLLLLYFAYYPPTFEVMYFTAYQEAYDWLVARAAVGSAV